MHNQHDILNTLRIKHINPLYKQICILNNRKRKHLHALTVSTDRSFLLSLESGQQVLHILSYSISLNLFSALTSLTIYTSCTSAITYIAHIINTSFLTGIFSSHPSRLGYLNSSEDLH